MHPSGYLEPEWHFTHQYQFPDHFTAANVRCKQWIVADALIAPIVKGHHSLWPDFGPFGDKLHSNPVHSGLAKDEREAGDACCHQLLFYQLPITGVHCVYMPAHVFVCVHARMCLCVCVCNCKNVWICFVCMVYLSERMYVVDCWSFLNSAILLSGADSRHSCRVILNEWL